MHTICPGARVIRQPKPEIFSCPYCGTEVEIWSDELKGICSNCKKTVMRSQELSCLEWCKLAQDCVGEETYNKYMTNRAITIKQKLINELEEYFGDDKKRIEHAKKVLSYAEELLKKEHGDWHIIVAASILHDVGIKIAEEKYGSPAGHLQEKEGPPVAKKILLKMGLKMQDIDEICEIIAHHHSPGIITTKNFKILSDADWLVNMKDEVKTKDQKKLEKTIEKVFLTPAGKEMARSIYLSP